MFVSTKEVDAPTYSNVVSVADMKTHLRITHTDDDRYLEALRDAACSFVEAYTNRAVTSARTVEFNYSGFSNVLELPRGPINEVTSIKYKASKDAANTFLAAADFYADISREPAVVKFPNPPTADAQAIAPVVITCEIGGNLPRAIKHAILLLVAHFYENRQSVVTGTIATEVPLGLRSLLNPFRIVSFA